MKKYKYKVIKHYSTELEAALNEAGAQGWEIDKFNIVEKNGVYCVVIMKMEI